MNNKSVAEYLRSLPKEELVKAVSKLTPKQQEEILYDWSIWARDKQVEPEGDWYIWFLNCGRSFGKSRTGSEWIREQVKRGAKDIAILGRTAAEVYDICLFGKSGLLNVCWEGDKTYKGKHLGVPVYSPTRKRLTWANGASAKLFSSEEPEALRGSQFSHFWADELGSWTRDQETWDQLQFCMRLGKKPRGIVTTTPRSTPLIRSLVARSNGGDVYMTTGSSYENKAMPESFFAQLKEKYEGTRLGQQEIYAEVLAENENALWTSKMIDECKIYRKDVPHLERVVVAFDPATTKNTDSDLTGIVVAGIDINGIGYVLEDHTMKDSPEKCASKAIELLNRWEASKIVYETNQGGDYIPTLFRHIDENVPLKGIHASRSKIARAEPVSMLYEKGRVKHVIDPEYGDTLYELEVQMTTFEPLGKKKSPDRYDSAVYALTELFFKGKAIPKLAMSYSKAGDLSESKAPF